ncbi:MAG TPA: hypothetical protein VGF30_04600 [Bacteroidia bacterium]
MSEEEDTHSSEGKDFGGKEGKFHTSPLAFVAILVHHDEEQGRVSSDGKTVNHSFEINSPPPNC